jgi:thiol-disulfide isomerase/thioredoxin
MEMGDARSSALGVEWHSRRSFTLGGLIGTVSCLVAGTAPIAQPSEAPFFRSGRFQFTTIRPQRELPSARLFGLDGKTTDLVSLRGRPILLNFWASWCAACKIELPILDRLVGEKDIHVVAISEDRGGRKAVTRFADSLKLRRLPIYLDPNGYVAHSDPDNTRNAPFALYGMPITYLIASSGLVVGYMPGAVDREGTSAKTLIEYLRNA